MINKLLKVAIPVLGLTMTANPIFAQTNTPAKEVSTHGWHLLDHNTDGYYGISLNKAYDFLKSTHRKPKTVTVAVLDSGVDTAHVDLKNVLWHNPKEIPGNGIDDDKNGYVDDVYGWNFLGSKDGQKNVTKDSYASARLFWKYKTAFEGKTENQIPKKEKGIYKDWLRARAEVQKNENAQVDTKSAQRMKEFIEGADAIVQKEIGKKVYTIEDLKEYKPTDARVVRYVGLLKNISQANQANLSNTDLIEAIDNDVRKMQESDQAPQAYRDEVVGDDYANFKDRFYGNNNVFVNGSSAFHGTHVAGIIGADRTNNTGINGIADDVKIMAVRGVPDGDEHDKDIALGIRYAVDNGAKVINMSFGKGYSPEKKWVDDAYKYAAKKGVLLVHAAGNDAKNVDTTFNFPNVEFLNGKRPTNLITVGASGDQKIGGIVAKFSNFGKRDVDIFAPGVKIYSTVPGDSTYKDAQGTSMASPVVAGVAALVMSYYPELSAVQVKKILEESATPIVESVKNPANNSDTQLKELSRTGGIVNAYNAVKLADDVVNKRVKLK